MIGGMLVEDEFFSDLIAKHLNEYAKVAGTQQNIQVTEVPGMPPVVAPQWLLQQFFQLKMELLRVSLQLTVTKYILEGVSATDRAHKEDTDIQQIFEMVETKVEEYMKKYTQATTSKESKPTIVLPSNNNGRLPPRFEKGM